MHDGRGRRFWQCVYRSRNRWGADRRRQWRRRRQWKQRRATTQWSCECQGRGRRSSRYTGLKPGLMSGQKREGYIGLSCGRRANTRRGAGGNRCARLSRQGFRSVAGARGGEGGQLGGSSRRRRQTIHAVPGARAATADHPAILLRPHRHAALRAAALRAAAPVHGTRGQNHTQGAACPRRPGCGCHGTSCDRFTGSRRRHERCGREDWRCKVCWPWCQHVRLHSHGHSHAPLRCRRRRRHSCQQCRCGSWWRGRRPQRSLLLWRAAAGTLNRICALSAC
jgi:hypothetical protein